MSTATLTGCTETTLLFSDGTSIALPEGWTAEQKQFTSMGEEARDLVAFGTQRQGGFGMREEAAIPLGSERAWVAEQVEWLKGQLALV